MQVNFASAEEEVETTEEPIIEVTSETIAQPLELTIEQAVQLATDSDREMWKIDDGLEELDEMKDDGKDAKDMAEALMSLSIEYISYLEENEDYDIVNDYLELILSKNGYYVLYAKTQIEQLEKNREVVNLGIEIEAKSLYYQALVAEKTIEIDQTKLDKVKEQLRVINLKFDNGSATKAEVLSGELAVQQAQTDLDSATDDFEIAKLDLLNKLDLPLDTEITLVDKELTYVPTDEIDLDATIEKAKEERPEILAAENNLELQEIETHAYVAYYTDNNRQSKSAVEKLKDAELDVPQSYKDVELDVRESYLNLVKAERALVNMDKTVELLEEAARVNKLLFESGMAASLDVLNADTDLAEAEIGRYQLLVAYNINKLMFDNSNLIGSSSASNI
jgi:hypothetical protein